MFYAIVTYFLACLVDLLTAKWMREDEKDLEIALLRQQLRIVERRQERGPHIPRWQKVPLAVLAVRLRERSRQAKEKLDATILLFRPATLIIGIGQPSDAVGLPAEPETGTPTD